MMKQSGQEVVTSKLVEYGMISDQEESEKVPEI